MLLAKGAATAFLTLLLVGLAFTLTSIGPIATARASPRTISLIGYIPGWNNSLASGSNPQITVIQRESVTLQLSSGDGFPHQFIVDVDNDGGSDTADCGSVDQCSAAFSTAGTTFPLLVNFPAGTYTYYCSVHPMTMFGKFVVEDFTVALSPATLTIVQGSTGTSTISLTSLSGFTGTVNLTASISPTGPSVTLNPVKILLSSDGPATSTLTISGSNSSNVGIYTATVTATHDLLLHSLTLPITLKSPSPGVGNLPAWAIPTGAAIIAASGIAIFVVRRRASKNPPLTAD